MIDRTHPSEYERADKIKWLSNLDHRAYITLKAHETEIAEFVPYDEDTDGSTELLIPAPYDEVYHQYLDMQISLKDRDYAFYNNAAVLFEGMWKEYTGWVNRTYMPKQPNHIFKFKGNRDVQTSYTDF